MEGYSELWKACHENNVDALKDLLTPENVNDKINGEETTILEDCVMFGRLECIRYIMEEFKSVIEPRVFVDALGFAISRNCLQCIKYLLTHCNRYVINLRDDQSRTPLEYAILIRHENTVKLLIDHDAKTDGISGVPQWVYEYENSHRERKKKCMALMGVFKRKRAPKDMTKWMINQVFKFL